MEETVLLSWKGAEGTYHPKDMLWYWAIGIAAGGVAVAAVLVSNYLFAVVAIFAGFAIMVVGSRRPPRHIYTLTTKGIAIGATFIPYEKITRFAIRENETPTLIIETMTLSGMAMIPLANTDWRRVKMELKNQNIEEMERLGSVIESVERALGL